MSLADQSIREGIEQIKNKDSDEPDADNDVVQEHYDSFCALLHSSHQDHPVGDNHNDEEDPGAYCVVDSIL